MGFVSKQRRTDVNYDATAPDAIKPELHRPRLT